jgi:hypothetical protein
MGKPGKVCLTESGRTGSEGMERDGKWWCQLTMKRGISRTVLLPSRSESSVPVLKFGCLWEPGQNGQSWFGFNGSGMMKPGASVAGCASLQGTDRGGQLGCGRAEDGYSTLLPLSNVQRVQRVQRSTLSHGTCHASLQHGLGLPIWFGLMLATQTWHLLVTVSAPI